MIDIFEDIETAMTIQTLALPTLGDMDQPFTPRSPEMILKKSKFIGIK